MWLSGPTLAGPLLERDAAAECPRCHGRTPCPREADWVQCDGCKLVFDGPEMSPERRTYRDAIRYATARKTWVRGMESKLPTDRSDRPGRDR